MKEWREPDAVGSSFNTGHFATECAKFPDRTARTFCLRRERVRC